MYVVKETSSSSSNPKEIPVPLCHACINQLPPIALNSIYRFFLTGSSSFLPDIPASTATTATMIPATIAFFFLSSDDPDVFFAGVAGFGGAIGAAAAGAGLEDADLDAAFFSFLDAFLSFLDAAAGWAAGAVGVATGAAGAAGVVVVAGALILLDSFVCSCDDAFPFTARIHARACARAFPRVFNFMGGDLVAFEVLICMCI